MAFYRGSPPVPAPQLLELTAGDRRFGLALLHTSREEVRALPGRTRTPGTPHAHALYHVVLYTAGRGHLALGQGVAAFRPGTLAVTSPGTPHNFHARENVAFVYKELTFALEHGAGACELPLAELLGRYAGAAFAEPEWPVQLNARQAWRLECLLDLQERVFAERGPLVWYHAHRVAGDILDFLIAEVYAGTAGPVEAGADRLALARQELELRACEPLRMAELARLAGCSLGHFQRRFKARYGVAPLAYQQELRLRVARHLLRHSDYRIGEIAERTGFGTGYYFCRVFRRHAGCSPRAWRAGEQGLGR